MAERIAATLVWQDDLAVVEDRRRKTPTGSKREFALIGGAIEPGETEVEAAVRELKEELGINVDPRAMGEHTQVNRFGLSGFIFETKVGSDLKLEDSAKVKILRFKPEDLYINRTKLQSLFRGYMERQWRLV